MPSLNEAITTLVTADDEGCRLDRWFKRHHPQLSHGFIEKALRTGKIRINGSKASSNQRLEEGQTITIRSEVLDASHTRHTPPTKQPKQATAKQRQMLLDAVLYKDDDIIVINKPAGLAVQGGSKVTTSLDDLLDVLKFEKSERPKLVHRLDKDTSGVMLLARTTKAAATLTQSFRHKDIQKVYWSIVVGTPPAREGKINIPLAKSSGSDGYERMQENKEQGEAALTYYRVVESVSTQLAWLELRPVTGRTHQLRIHCQLLGTPIAGDGKYGGGKAFISGLPAKLHLHARQIILPDLFGKEQIFTAPLPPHMQTSWEMFGFDLNKAV